MKSKFLSHSWGAPLFALQLLLFASLSMAKEGQEGGDGGGFNGPNFGVISIPEKLDAQLAEPEIERAVETCLIRGDSKRGLVSSFQDLYRQAFGKLPDYVDERGMSLSSWISAEAGETQALVLKKAKLKLSPVNLVENSTDIHEDMVSSKSIFLQVRDHKNWATVHPEGFIQIPYVAYKLIRQSDGYDLWGVPKNLRMIISSVSVLGMTKPLLPMVTTLDNNNEMKVPLTFNALAYAQCLQNEVQKQFAESRRQ